MKTKLPKHFNIEYDGTLLTSGDNDYSELLPNWGSVSYSDITLFYSPKYTEEQATDMLSEFVETEDYAAFGYDVYSELGEEDETEGADTETAKA
jgi:hypothetical protein